LGECAATKSDGTTTAALSFAGHGRLESTVLATDVVVELAPPVGTLVVELDVDVADEEPEALAVFDATSGITTSAQSSTAKRELRWRALRGPIDIGIKANGGRDA
jgi:hypothetical protein